MLCFKHHGDACEWGVKADPLLRKILERMDEHLHQYARHATVTSFIRKKTTDTGVHETGRAVDVRSHGLSIAAIRGVEVMINQEFPRSDGRLTCFYHDVGQGPHFHVQVEPVERRIVRATS